VWFWDHDPFGNGTPTGSFTNRQLFPGQFQDGETGLNYNYFRDYDPITGRYIESDPIGLDGGINPYVYVKNDPANKVDPSGTCGEDLCILEGAAVITGAYMVSQAVKGIASEIAKFCPPKGCPPCKTISGKIVEVGTIGYRPLDIIPDTEEQHGVYGSHYNLFKANQYPYPKCDCFWQKLKDVAKPDGLLPGWIPIEPFAN
jgi:RHS repeat-associated protein